MNLYNRRKLVSVPHFITGFFIIYGILVAGLLVADAALLKDVRIGEYKGFTRIVFELDASGHAPHIQPQTNGILAISFDDAQPDLNRKIPVERSENVRELKFWHREDRLSIILQFDFEHFRFETFHLQQPPRVALDIHPLTAKPEVTDELLSTADQPVDTKPDTPTVQPSADAIETDVQQEASTAKETGPAESEAPAKQTSNTTNAQPGPEIDPPTPKYRPPEINTTSSAMSANEEQVPPTQPRSNRLQFYLVVSLVIITIVILALLLLMLLAKHRWTGDKDVPDVNEYLKNQDQRIATLNARIQEQFKRYEEA